MSSAGNLPPATPAYVLRGHTEPVHALHFYQQNSFLISGDSEGWVVIWRLSSKRPVACWRAHDGGILGIKQWESNVITHGRDHKLRVWQLNDTSLDGESLDTQLPAERGNSGDKSREPWLLHSMAVSALNFCSFAMCAVGSFDDEDLGAKEIFVAVPNALDNGGIDFFRLPSERRVSVLKSDPQVKTGMVMALGLFHHPVTELLTVISGYEDGSTMVHQRKSAGPTDEKWSWQKILVCRPHKQPVLSLDIAPSKDFYFTSSVDAVIAKLSIPTSSSSGDPNVKPTKTCNTRHAGQQGLAVRNDGKIFATGGWDARIRVYSTKTLKELAVLKWHQDGCYSIAFADVSVSGADTSNGQDEDQPPVASTTSQQSSLEVIKHQRSVKAQQTHWLAAGGKDGKISLWDIY